MMFDFDYRLWIMYSFNLKKKNSLFVYIETAITYINNILWQILLHFLTKTLAITMQFLIEQTFMKPYYFDKK